MFLSTPSPRHQTSLVSRHVTNCLSTLVLSTPSPRPRTSPFRPCGSSFKNYQSPLRSKTKLPTIHTLSRILSVFHVIFTFLHLRKTPNQGFFRSVVHVLRLWIRFVRQDLVCVHGDDVGNCFLIRVILTVPPYIFFFMYHLPKRHMMVVHV